MCEGGTRQICGSYNGSTLRGKASAHNIPVGQWIKVQGKFKMHAHPSSGVVMDIGVFKVSHSVGCDIDTTALQASMQSVQWGDGGNVWEGSKCELPPLHTAHTQGTRSIQWGDGGNAADGSKCKHSHTAVPKSRARAQQSVSSRASVQGGQSVQGGDG